MLGSEELPIIFSTAYQRALIEDQVRGIRRVRWARNHSSFWRL